MITMIAVLKKMGSCAPAPQTMSALTSLMDRIITPSLSGAQMYNFTAEEILGMRPHDLKLALRKRLVLDTNLSATIAQMVGFEPKWATMSTIQLAMVALAWANLARPNYSIKLTIDGVLLGMTSLVNFSNTIKGWE
jgi:hypothetical protein